MRLYAIRHIEDKQAVGFFWADGVDDLIDMVDQVSDPDACEYQTVDESGAFIWDSYAPKLGVARNFEISEGEDELRRLMGAIGILGSLETFFYDDVSDDYWTPMHILFQGREPPKRVAPVIAAAKKEKTEKTSPKMRAPIPTPTDTIYFIECDGHVKIGVTSGPVKKRLKVLSTAHHSELILLATIENVSGEMEFNLHQRFAQYRTRGEWFVLSPEIKAYIETLKVGS